MKKFSLIIIFLVFFSGLGIFIGQFPIKQKASGVAGVGIDNLATPGFYPLPSASQLKVIQSISIPKTLQIPKIKVSANVESVGMNSKGEMDVPKLDANVAWYNLGGKIGQAGNAVFAGHLDTKAGSPAVFWDLDKLNKGDDITATDQQGKTYTYEVVDKKVYADAQFPLQEVFGDTTKKRLNLITCEGTYDKSARNYSDRLVVYSEMVE